jgi:hypothetical protein
MVKPIHMTDHVANMLYGLIVGGLAGGFLAGPIGALVLGTIGLFVGYLDRKHYNRIKRRLKI